MITAVDEKSVVVGAAKNAKAWRAAEIGVSIDRQTFISIGESGWVFWVDYDTGSRWHAATGRNVAVFAREGAVGAAVSPSVHLFARLNPATRLPSVVTGAVVVLHAAATQRLLNPIPRVLECAETMV